MKKFLFIPLLAALLIAACSKQATDPVLQIGSAPALTSPANGTSYVLVDSTSEEIFSLFTWTAAEYGFDAGVSYTLELDRAGNNFADPITIGTVNALELRNVTNGKINSILLNLGLPGEEEADIEFRVSAKINPEVQILYSQPITLKITPFTIVIVYPFLHVPGSYQGWNPADSFTVVYSARSDEKYEGYVYFNDAAAKYKYTKGPSWSTNWGDTGADGSLDPNGTDISLSGAAGVYKLNADLNALTHSLTRTDWGIIGDATPTGWNSDTDMVYDQAEKKYTITLDLGVGKIKFRANDDWAINLGDNDANKSLEYGGADINITEAGNYTVELLLGGAIYRYKATKN